MDPVTHLLAGYLLGTAAFGSGALVAWTTFMAFFPDLDSVAWVWKGKPSWLRHRGVTHSLAVGTGVSLVAAAAFALLTDVPFLAAFLAGMIGFVSHVGLDYLNWGCLILWPWRSSGVEYTVQMGLKGPLVASTVGWAVVSAGIALGWKGWAVALVGGAWLAYLVAKLLLKTHLARRHGRGAAVYPTAHPLRWRVIDTRAADGHRETRYLRAAFTPALREAVVMTSRHRVEAPALPLKSPEDAAAFTFNVPEVQRLAAQDLALAVDVAPAEADGWVARWYALDYQHDGGCFGALVRVASDGTYDARLGRLPFVPAQAGSVSA